MPEVSTKNFQGFVFDVPKLKLKTMTTRNFSFFCVAADFFQCTLKHLWFFAFGTQKISFNKVDL